MYRVQERNLETEKKRVYTMMYEGIKDLVHTEYRVQPICSQDFDTQHQDFVL